MKIFASLPLLPHVDAVCFDFPSRCNLSSPPSVPPSHFLSSIVPFLLCPHSFQTTDTQYSCNFLVLVNLFLFLQLYKMSSGWMKFGFQLSGTHRPVSHTHTALGLISFANIASPSTSETQSLALLNVSKLSQKCPNCKHCVTKHHFRDTLICTLTLRILPDRGVPGLCQ